MKNQTDDFVYIAIKPCGHACAATVDGAGWKKETAKTIAGWVREGYTVERRTRADGVAELKKCEHGVISEQLKAAKKQQAQDTNTLGFSSGTAE